jgi:hypothetical protein
VLMMSWHGMLPAAVLFLMAAPAWAGDAAGYEAWRSAQEYLQRGGDYLRAAPNDPEGRRDRAIAYVNRALQEIHSALSGDAQPGSREQKMQQRNQQLEDKRLQREQQLEQKQLQRDLQQQER